MKNKIAVVVSVCFFALVACGPSSDHIQLEDPLASGRGFIEAALKADYVKANKYLLQDSTNQQYLEGLIDFNKSSTKEERENYRNASIIVDSMVPKSDTTQILYYKNSFKKEPSKLKMVRKDNQWLVDFKYSFREEN